MRAEMGLGFLFHLLLLATALELSCFATFPQSSKVTSGNSKKGSGCRLSLFCMNLRGGGRKLGRDKSCVAARPPPAKQLIVKGFKEHCDEEGKPLVSLFVEDAAGGTLDQPLLDEIVSSGAGMPALVFNDEMTAKRFVSWQQSHIQMDLRVLDPSPQTIMETHMEGIEGAEQVAGNSVDQCMMPEFPPDSESRFFNAYDKLSVHELMLKDEPRSSWFQHEIQGRPEIFSGSTVLDVGAGTGILSMFAARAGGKRVYAVEAAPGMAGLAKSLVQANGMSNVVQVMDQKVETLKLNEQVDVIVSEWMGFYLLHESMIHSVIWARDAFLKKGGLMLPSGVQIHAAPVTAETLWESRVGFWKNATATWGLNMSIVASDAQRNLADDPIIAYVSKDELMAAPQVVWDADMHTVTHEDAANVSAKLTFRMSRDGMMRGICLWFSAWPMGQGTPLSTGPLDAETHWRQTVVMLGTEVAFKEGEQVGVFVSIGSGMRGGEPQGGEMTREKNIMVELHDPSSPGWPQIVGD